MQKDIKETSYNYTVFCIRLFLSSSMAVNIVRELEDKEHHKNNLIFYNVPEPTTPSWKADSAYISDLCRIIFDLNVEIIKSIRIGKKTDKKHRPLLIHLSN